MNGKLEYCKRRPFGLFSLVASVLTVGFMLVAGSPGSEAQAIPVGVRTLAISPFAMGSHVDTDYGSTNYGVTFGADVTRYYHRFSPSIEGRYTYSPSRDSGIVEQSFGGGVKVQTDIRRIHPYATLLFGFGTIKFLQNSQDLYDDSSVYLAGGGGVDVEITSRFSVKGDAQLERWKLSGAANSLQPMILSAGISYTLPAKQIMARFQRGLHY